MVSSVNLALKLPFYNNMFTNMLFSCTARADDLDNIGGLDVTRRCHEHTDALLEAFSSKDLWVDYGIVGDIIVSGSNLDQ